MARSVPPPTMSFTTVAARLLVPAWIVVIAGLQMADGSTDALPVWMAGLAGRAGTSPSSLLRILLGSELLLAGLMFLIGRWARALAIVTMIATCFSAIASISAAPEQRSVVGFNVLVLVVSAVLLWSVLRGRTAGGGTLSLQWQLIGALAVGVVAATMASQIPIRVVDPSGPELRVKRPPQAIELDFARFINQPLTASGIGKHLPQLTAKALDGRHIIVFYNTSCGICHELFREHFSGHLSTPVIAVRVPPGVNDRGGSRAISPATSIVPSASGSCSAKTPLAGDAADARRRRAGSSSASPSAARATAWRSTRGPPARGERTRWHATCSRSTLRQYFVPSSHEHSAPQLPARGCHRSTCRGGDPGGGVDGAGLDRDAATGRRGLPQRAGRRGHEHANRRGGVCGGPGVRRARQLASVAASVAWLGSNGVAALRSRRGR
ncbi:MAG: DoxX family protein [Phycisphaerales bacterium]